ncbi:MAG: carboxylesterase family protein [Butyrivibrio sp.]|nr:carboxylesterase family protein [Butyrivibrio sp.]
MSVFEEIIISITKKNMSSALNLNAAKEISTEGIKEDRDISYYNRSGKELFMDIFQPQVPSGTELPVIINVHGGGLIDGNKNLSVGFCRQLAKRGYLVCSLEYRLIPNVRVYEQFDDVCWYGLRRKEAR